MAREMRPSCFGALPPSQDAATCILSFLDASSLSAVACSCHFASRVSEDSDEYVWRMQCDSTTSVFSWREQYFHEAAEAARTALSVDDVVNGCWHIRFLCAPEASSIRRAYFSKVYLVVEGFPLLPWRIENNAVQISTFPPHVSSRRRDGGWLLRNENVVIFDARRERRRDAEAQRDRGDMFVSKEDYLVASTAYSSMLDNLGGLHATEPASVLSLTHEDALLRAEALVKLANVNAIIATSSSVHQRRRLRALSVAWGAANRVVSSHFDVLSPSLRKNLEEVEAATMAALGGSLTVGQPTCTTALCVEPERPVSKCDLVLPCRACVNIEKLTLV